MSSDPKLLSIMELFEKMELEGDYESRCLITKQAAIKLVEFESETDTSKRLVVSHLVRLQKKLIEKGYQGTEHEMLLIKACFDELCKGRTQVFAQVPIVCGQTPEGK